MPDNDRDYITNPCKYLDYVLINRDWDKDWKCMRGYGLCPRCEECKEYERSDKE